VRKIDTSFQDKIFDILIILKDILEVFNKGLKNLKLYAHKLGEFQLLVLFTVFYFLILTPYGIIMRIFKRSDFNLNLKVNSPTYWNTKPKKDNTINMEYPF
jgi:hypothetical protein